MQFNHSTGRNLRVLLVAPLSNPLIAMDKALVSSVPAEVLEILFAVSVSCMEVALTIVGVWRKSLGSMHCNSTGCV